MSDSISGKTKLICLLGSPVEHSLSPIMHNSAFNALDLDYRYLAFDVKSEDLSHIIPAFKTMNVRGFNLTMPLKKDIIPYLDEISPAARLSNSVNTVVNYGGRLCGYTTDGRGFLDALLEKGFDYKGKKAVLLGFGGAASSIAVEGALTGFREISIFKRNNSTFKDVVSFAKKLEKESNCKINVYSFDDSQDLKREINDSNLLINGTNVGMKGDERSLVDPSFLRKDLFVSDLIYEPEMTKLLSDAEEAGCEFMNGKYMLLYQGAAAFKMWTGLDMPIHMIKDIFD